MFQVITMAMVGEEGLEPSTPGLEGRFGPLSPSTTLFPVLLQLHELKLVFALFACPVLPFICRQGPPKIPPQFSPAICVSNFYALANEQDGLFTSKEA